MDKDWTDILAFLKKKVYLMKNSKSFHKWKINKTMLRDILAVLYVNYFFHKWNSKELTIFGFTFSSAKKRDLNVCFF